MSDGKILAFYAPYTGAGKSTAANYLNSNDINVFIMSFADPLYSFAGDITNASRYAKNEKFDEFGGKSLRDFLIHFGMAGREFYADIWSKKLRRKIKYFRNSFNIVIDDLRFPNEYAMLREEGAKIVRITNPGHVIIKSDTEAQLEGYKFDYELINYKRGLEEYRTQLDEMMRELWP